jgi:hypothetical protein
MPFNYLTNKNQTHMTQTTLHHDLLIEKHLEHLTSEHHRLRTDTASPQFWFLTVTFVPIETKRADHIPIPPHRCFALFEQFYVRLLSKLMNNFERKRALQPLAYVYADYPFTKREKTYATLSSTEQFQVNPYRFHPDHPETTCHIHSVMVVAPKLVDRFRAIKPTLERYFQDLNPATRTLHAVPLQSPNELRDVMFYSSKLLRCPPMSLRDIDLYTVMPKAESEPIYVKSDWERELEAELKEAKKVRALWSAKRRGLYKYIEGENCAESETKRQARAAQPSRSGS